MRTYFLPLSLLSLLPLLGCGSAGAAAQSADAVERAEVAEVGARAPDFTLADLDGEPWTLSDHEGKTVVLEWFNPECPVVKRHHGQGALKDLAARLANDDLVWVAINSGAPGKQGHGIEKNADAAEGWEMDYPILIDESGEVGRKYGAKTTPHMYVIDPDGVLVYMGDVDNAPGGRKPEGEDLRIYVDEAVQAIANGEPIEVATTKPFGCSVKYAE